MPRRRNLSLVALALTAALGASIAAAPSSGAATKTTKKKTTVAVIRKVSTALMNSPYWNFDPLTVKASCVKPFPKMAPMIGVMKALNLKYS